MDKRIVPVDGEDFVVTKGSGECELNVTNGNDTASVTWHKATQQYRGDIQWLGQSMPMPLKVLWKSQRGELLQHGRVSLNQKPAKGWISTLKVSPVSQNTLG